MKNDTQKVVVLIPIYRDFFDDFEIKSLKSVHNELSNFPIIFIAPESLNTDFLNRYEITFNFEIYRFEDDYFRSIEGYNQLLLSSHFYKAFLNYEYLLICQTDAYVFKNELSSWVSKGFDYIGAPWLDSKKVLFNHTSRSIFNKIKKKIGLKERLYNHINQVGNGGFSLRKTAKFHEISTKEEVAINNFLKNKEKENYHIEDVFWSLYVPQKYPFLKPDYQTAMRFCVDRKPEVAFTYLNGKLPFACHGFNKKGVVKFWSKYIS
ncbi:DUF5672 family protein [Paenimyroides aestuarii]|uniref:DUF5672 domain-containing protein n=1 Tax=Paenimyroides aestuarii TaxID=2968490 RepID=A0ABY5NQ41_9FLAO|nr:DUF5672 family protein [Paenimyroides aestuarii]UUV20636.1 hypothetical protein NPX36_09795 [Paenimyroides aestuarii]